MPPEVGVEGCFSPRRAEDKEQASVSAPFLRKGKRPTGPALLPAASLGLIDDSRPTGLEALPSGLALRELFKKVGGEAH